MRHSNHFSRQIIRLLASKCDSAHMTTPYRGGRIRFILQETLRTGVHSSPNLRRNGRKKADWKYAASHSRPYRHSLILESWTPVPCFAFADVRARMFPPFYTKAEYSLVHESQSIFKPGATPKRLSDPDAIPGAGLSYVRYVTNTEKPSITSGLHSSKRHQMPDVLRW